MSNDKNEVWLSGDETIHWVSELFTGPIDPRDTGRTIRLALRYVETSLLVAPCRVKVVDHFPTQQANWNLTNLIRKIFDAINIDYKIEEIPEIIKVPGSFTGTAATGEKSYFLTAEPRGLKTQNYRENEVPKS